MNDEKPQDLAASKLRARLGVLPEPTFERSKDMSITITAKELRVALEFCNPDGPEDENQAETELTIWMQEVDDISAEGEPFPRGLYCHLTDYPEEGCIPLFEATASENLPGAGDTAQQARRARERSKGNGW